MSFNQFKLDIATTQARGIFNQYVYKTDEDTVVETQASGYFAQSRFIKTDPDWVGSFITVEASNGIWFGTFNSSGTGVAIPSGTVPVDNCRIGFLNYNDLATASSPIAHTGGVDTVLTCDELGAQNLKTFAPNGIADVWDKDNDRFFFSDLKVGDMLDIRLDITVTTLVPNQTVSVDLELAQGGFDYQIPFDTAIVKNASTNQISRFNGIYMGDTNTLDNFGQFIFTSPDDATIIVNGWYCKILIRG
jgi:hypothetical protein